MISKNDLNKKINELTSSLCEKNEGLFLEKHGVIIQDEYLNILLEKGTLLEKQLVDALKQKYLLKKELAHISKVQGENNEPFNRKVKEKSGIEKSIESIRDELNKLIAQLNNERDKMKDE